MKPSICLVHIHTAHFGHYAQKWNSILTDVEVHEFENVGHFVQEELGDELCPLIEKHLEKIKA